MADLRKDQKLLLGATAASLALWLIPGLGLLLYPLTLLNTHIHELGHALAGLGTGGSVEKITVNANGSGQALIAGGWILPIASAGYVGAALIGGFLIAAARTAKGARTALWAGAAFLAFSMVAFVRGDLMGILSGLSWTLAFGLMAWKLSDSGAILASQFLGVQQCLTSVVGFLALFQASTGEVHSDALIMQQATGVPDMVWAAAWFLLSVVIVASTLSAAWKGSAARAQ